MTDSDKTDFETTANTSARVSPIGGHTFRIIGFGNLPTRQFLTADYVKAVKNCGCEYIACRINDIKDKYEELPKVELPGYNPLADSQLFSNLAESLTNCSHEEMGFVPYVEGPMPDNDSDIPGNYINTEWVTYMYYVLRIFGKAINMSGWLLLDQPKTFMFHTMYEMNYNFSAMVNGSLWLNLCPLDAKESQLGLGMSSVSNEAIYQNYIDCCQTDTTPAIWSSSFKAFKFTTGVPILKPDYFRSLSLYNYLSVISGKPFYSVISTSTERTDYFPDLRTAFATSILNTHSPATIRLQVSCSLAFGAVGLVYDKMALLPLSINNIVYYSAPIIADGDSFIVPGYLYSYIRDINQKVKSHSHIFASTTAMDVRCEPQNVELYSELPPLTESFPLISAVSIDSPDTSVLLSHLQSEGRAWVMVVNLDYHYHRVVKLTFKNDLIATPYGLSEDDPEGKAISADPSNDSEIEEGKTYEFTIKGGDYLLFEIPDETK